jgi:hypothetical protein
LPSVFLRELPKVIDELQIEVVDAPLGLILVPEKTAVISAAVNSYVRLPAASSSTAFNAGHAQTSC